MSFFSFIPAPALIFLVILVFVIIVSVALLAKRKKPAEGQIPNQPIPPQPPQPVLPQEGTVPVQPVNQPTPISPTEPVTQTMNISSQPVKPDEGKYVALIVVAAILAVLIPLAAIVIVRSQPAPAAPAAEQIQTTTCNAVTLTDTLGTVLSESDLSRLRPGDEVKILISATGVDLSKARFRVNGSPWQEVTNKEGNNFIGNYILDAQSKFTIEAEVYNKEKGWL